MNKNGLCFMIFTHPMACIPANLRTWDMIFSTSCLLNQHSPWAVSDKHFKKWEIKKHTYTLHKICTTKRIKYFEN